MNVINILLILIILYMLYILVYSKPQKTRENYDSIRRQHKYKQDGTSRQKIINDVISWDDSYSTYDSGVLRKEPINPNILDVQFHNDYRDVITAINNLVPDQKQLLICRIFLLFTLNQRLLKLKI